MGERDAAAEEPKLSALCAAWEGLGPRARGLLVAIAGRLVKGAAEHGDFDPAVKRNWAAETREELLDAVCYLSLATMGGAPATRKPRRTDQGWFPSKGDRAKLIELNPHDSYATILLGEVITVDFVRTSDLPNGYFWLARACDNTHIGEGSCGHWEEVL